VQLPGRLIAAENKVQQFRVALLDSRVTEKTDRERKSGDSVGDRRAGGCAASRGMRVTCVAFGIRNHPRERIADRHGAYRPALPGFGPVEEPEDLQYRLPFAVLPWSRDPSSSSEIEVIIVH
jgi:hypothetical protein